MPARQALRLGSRDQGAAIDCEGEPPEPPLPEHVLQRLARRAPGDQGPGGVELPLRQLTIKRHVELDATQPEHMREQTLGVEPWCAAALLLEVLRRAAQHLAEQRRHAPAASSDSRLSSPWSASVNSSRSPLRT